MQPFDPLVLIPIFIAYILISAMSVVLLYKKKMSKKLSVAVLLAAVIVPGFILGLAAHPTSPHPVNPPGCYFSSKCIHLPPVVSTSLPLRNHGLANQPVQPI